MSNLKTLIILSTLTFFSGPAIGQDNLKQTLNDDFTTADLDQSGDLNADEFVSFAIRRADNGDESFKDLVLGAEYRDSFEAYDTDESGGVDLLEVFPHNSAPTSLIEEPGDDLAGSMEDDAPDTNGPD